ncbi:serine/threonine-protein kinase [Glycomyces buryatensis]|uniref:non-specific serine/threonine protein kinase n=1 Tax=Glycomyces buryatensis TaxID=2570927 RepID=A0A4V4HSZ9_9ACTN|nr:serine/threonine-protein kinase [Glycomyces buryatensis]THV43016.1 serine/threonine protein kinase [Glycomyces buryatensis]
MANGTEPGDEWRLANRYRVGGLLGHGGMSEVFHGYDERLDRRVAIKLMRPVATPAAPDSPEAVEILDAIDRDRQRFLREIRTTARLEHPGIPAVYDTDVELGPDGSTRLWLVMQLLRGSTLETVLDGADYETGAPSVVWAASITAQIAAVLADVHQLDIVHRDIKPANVMIVDGGLVKVLDFGIAILHGAGALPRLTQVDRTVGTPAYMSPEQCQGRAVTAASDVYSLGCLFFELLTGDVPFHQTGGVELRTHHLHAPAPSARAERSDVPEAVDELVSSMLEKEPGDRPSAETVYEALLPLMTTVDVVDAVWTGPERRDPTRPFRRPLLTTARTRETAEDKPALTELEAAKLNREVETLLEEGVVSEAIGLLEEAVERGGPDPAAALLLRRALGAALFIDGRYTRAASLFEKVGREFRKFLPPTDTYVLDCSYHAGHAFAETGKPEKALPHLRFYVQNADPGGNEEEAAKFRDSRFLVAQMLAATGRPDEALAEFEAVRPLLADAFGPDSTQIKNLDKHIERLQAAVRDGSRSQW